MMQTKSLSSEGRQVLENNILGFIHLGEEYTPHLWTNISHIQMNFPQIQCVLITDSKRYADRADSIGIRSHLYVREKKIIELFQKVENNFDFEFRSGFWKYSLERLFAFAEYHNTIASPLIHIESDVLLFKNFPWTKFYSLDKPGWQSLNQHSDVASILYSPSPAASKLIKQRLISLIEEDFSLTDMTALAKLREKFELDYITIPSSPKIDSKVHNEYPDSEIHRISSLTDYFTGYFDCAPIGMWNFGQDPRNNFGFTVRFKEMPESILDPSKVELKINNEGIGFQDQFGNNVYSIHMHSKKLKFFSEHNFEIMRAYLAGKYKNQKKIFEVDMFTDLIKDYYRRGKILELIGNLPFILALNKFVIFRLIRRSIKNLLYLIRP